MCSWALLRLGFGQDSASLRRRCLGLLLKEALKAGAWPRHPVAECQLASLCGVLCLSRREGPVESASSPARPVLRWPLGALAAAACQWGFGPAAAFARAVVSLMCLLLQCTRAPAVSSACFHLSAEQLRSLKARTLRRPSSQGEAPRADSSHALAAKLSPPPTASQAAPWASTDDVLCALLWQASPPNPNHPCPEHSVPRTPHPRREKLLCHRRATGNAKCRVLVAVLWVCRS